MARITATVMAWTNLAAPWARIARQPERAQSIAYDLHRNDSSGPRPIRRGFRPDRLGSAEVRDVLRHED